MKHSQRLAAAAVLVSMLAAPAQAGTVRWLHIEQNPDVAAFYTDVARRFEAANPGATVEMQYLENEAYKKKLTTLLQSPDRPNIIYSWGGGVLREQVKAGVIEDLSAAMTRRLARTVQPGGAPGLHLGRQGLRRADADLTGRLLLQQGPVREGRRRRGRDQDLGRPARGGEEAEGCRRDADHRRRRRQVADPLLLDASRDAQRRQARVRGRAARRGRGLRRRALRQGRRTAQAAGRPRAVSARLPRRHLSAVVRPVRRRQGRDGCCRATSC